MNIGQDVAFASVCVVLGEEGRRLNALLSDRVGGGIEINLAQDLPRQCDVIRWREPLIVAGEAGPVDDPCLTNFLGGLADGVRASFDYLGLLGLWKPSDLDRRPKANLASVNGLNQFWSAPILNNCRALYGGNAYAEHFSGSRLGYGGSLRGGTRMLVCTQREIRGLSRYRDAGNGSGF